MGRNPRGRSPREMLASPGPLTLPRPPPPLLLGEVHRDGAECRRPGWVTPGHAAEASPASPVHPPPAPLAPSLPWSGLVYELYSPPPCEPGSGSVRKVGAE